MTPLPPDRSGAPITEAADLLRRIDQLMGTIEAFKTERAAEAVRSARARLGAPHHAKRAVSAERAHAA